MTLHDELNDEWFLWTNLDFTGNVVTSMTVYKVTYSV